MQIKVICTDATTVVAMGKGKFCGQAIATIMYSDDAFNTEYK